MVPELWGAAAATPLLAFAEETQSGAMGRRTPHCHQVQDACVK
jgi:hypothetical protein